MQRLPGNEKTCLIETQWGRISYFLTYSKRRSILIRITNNPVSVRVVAPRFVSSETIQDFLHRKSRWIIRKLKALTLSPSGTLLEKSFKEGEEFLFLGNRFRLQVSGEDVRSTRLSFDGLKWSVIVPNKSSVEEAQRQIKERLLIWYQLQAKEILGQRVVHYSKILDLHPQEIIIKSQKTRWGSCDYRKRSIRLNWQIIMSPPEVMDYVIVHELCHLVIPNHSRAFWEKVAQIVPHYKIRRQWLNAHQNEMTMLR